jgi:glucose/arabinose dehydrogenase
LENAFPNLSFSSALFLTHAGDGTNRIFVVEQNGIIKVFENSPSTSTVKEFLDISDRVAAGGERGLLGLAFHPDYENNGYFYVNYTASGPDRTIISRFEITNNPDSADKDSEFELLNFSQPFSNHNGGWIDFGTNDGYLYIATGDGGGGGDPQNNGQKITTLLGKILRIDVDGGPPYAIPPDNPFIDSTGNVKKEIYAWGLRNPWRCSFDPVTHWLWAGDVGQNAWEEVDVIENGKNYGWRCYEGTHTYNMNGCNLPDSLYIKPIWEYPHSQGFSITGGYVYRGQNVPSLDGKYIYGDYGTRRIWALEYDGINPATNEFLLFCPDNISSFGVDQNNELYIIEFVGTNGNIYRFVPTVTSTDDESYVPEEFKLFQNYPNPFNPSTTIKYQVGNDGFVKLKVFNSLGEEVVTLVNKFQNTGSYNVDFKAADLPSGIYVYQLISNNFAEEKKMILLK